jgi:hypothetical protein
MAMTFGWTFEHIDEFVTLPQLKEMSRFWKKNPPIHQMIAAYLGIGKNLSVAGDVVSADEAGGAFFRDFAAAGGTLPVDLEEVK